VLPGAGPFMKGQMPVLIEVRSDPSLRLKASEWLPA